MAAVVSLFVELDYLLLAIVPDQIAIFQLFDGTVSAVLGDQLALVTLDALLTHGDGRQCCVAMAWAPTAAVAIPPLLINRRN